MFWDMVCFADLMLKYLYLYLSTLQSTCSWVHCKIKYLYWYLYLDFYKVLVLKYIHMYLTPTLVCMPHYWVLSVEASGISLQQGIPTWVSRFPGCSNSAEPEPSLYFLLCILGVIDAYMVEIKLYKSPLELELPQYDPEWLMMWTVK